MAPGGRAKGLRGDRKAPISNRRQGRRLCPAKPQDLPLRGRGTARGGGRSPWAVEGVRNPDGGRRSPRSPENSALALHMLHMLLMPRMPKAYDVFLQKPSGVLPENVEMLGMFFHRINVF